MTLISKTTIQIITSIYIITLIYDYKTSEKIETPYINSNYLSEIAKNVNNLQVSWKAKEYDKFKFLNSPDQIKYYLGGKQKSEESKKRFEASRFTYQNDTHTTEDLINSLPDAFDARNKWSKCKSIREIRDQSNCGASWAVSSAAVMSDRLCIGSKDYTDQRRISASDILSCCTTCGDGCNGGETDLAFLQATKTGFVTGNEFGNNTWCKPYNYEPCLQTGQNVNLSQQNCSKLTPPSKVTCEQTCQGDKSRNYKSDKIIAKSYKTFAGEADMMTEIYNNGPIVVKFSFYEDLLTYSSGVYLPTTSKQKGNHNVKVIGWGKVNDGTKYWLAVNSWNDTWGIGGLFWFNRGNNTLGFEDDAVSAMYGD